MIKKILFSISIVTLLVACGGQQDPTNAVIQEANKPVNVEGRKLFTGLCASCHMVNKELTGPALKGVEGRWSDRALLYEFVRNSQAVIAKDEYAKSLFMKYNQTVMTPFNSLTDTDIDNILEYINSVSN